METNDNNNNPSSAQLRSDFSVRAVINHAIEIGQLKPEQGEDLFWLHGYGLEHGLSNEELGERIGVSKGAISQLFSGKYAAADWSQMMRRIADYRRRDTHEIVKADVGFIETSVWKTIHEVCNNALNDAMPAFIYGNSQLGKTLSLLEYVRRMNSANVKYLRCRAAMTLSRFIHLLGALCHVSGMESKSNSEIVDRIVRSLNSHCLLIIDEFHLCMETVSSNTSKRLVEYIREIFDLSHCGLVLCATKVGMNDLEDGPNRMLFDQLRRRGVLKVILPDVPLRSDVNLISRSYGLSNPSGELLTQIQTLLRFRGLGVFCAYLQKSSRFAAKNHVPLSWDVFKGVSDGFESLSCLSDDWK